MRVREREYDLDACLPSDAERDEWWPQITAPHAAPCHVACMDRPHAPIMVRTTHVVSLSWAQSYEPGPSSWAGCCAQSSSKALLLHVVGWVYSVGPLAIPRAGTATAR